MRPAVRFWLLVLAIAGTVSAVLLLVVSAFVALGSLTAGDDQSTARA